MEELKDRLAEIMQIRNKKAIDVANGLGLSRSVISQYLSGKIVPKTKRVYELAQYLHCAPAWLIGFDVPMEEVQIDIDGLNTDQVRRIQAYAEMVRKGEL